jgi:phenylpropionate dioxygenase-like ring-hydroxylating dioxygenase large terminal subunit
MEAPPIEDSLSPLTPRFAAFDFDRFQPAGDWNIVYEGNWKVAVEGALENYHLPRLHSQVHRGSDPR